MDRKIIKTEDGSTTLYVPELNEHYHSIHGAVQESNHVFISAGLEQVEQEEIIIFEVGFGTGLNVLLTLLWAEKHKKKVHFYTIEKYPISTEEVLQLNFSDAIGNDVKEKVKQLHEAEWNTLVEINGNLSICKLEDDMKSVNFEVLPSFDLVYFDAFAPDVQPNLWSQEIFEKIYKKSSDNGLLTTYCAKGVVRRTMIACGYSVERIPGPPGKREMLRAKKEKS